MDFQHRPGGKTGSGGVASASESNRDRRERLRQLALETIDINKVSLGLSLCVLGKGRACGASPTSYVWVSSGLHISEVAWRARGSVGSCGLEQILLFLLMWDLNKKHLWKG